MNTPLNIQEFLKLSEKIPVIDVRSPGEFEQGHIPGAVNVPLFSNEERAKVGTAYVQISREEAVRIGYEIANPKINSFIAQVEKNAATKNVLVHCWRGGMRSGKFVQLLNEHKYKTHTLIKGYKAYRNFVLESFSRKATFLILGGETGSGKTEILKKIAEQGEQVIDLEAIAHHKGSAFGSLGEKPQPTHEQFENNLAHEWMKAVSPLSGGEGSGVRQRIWLEDESRNIGRTQIPLSLWEKMKAAPILRINVTKRLRIERLMTDYGKFSREELKACILKIEQRLGPQHVKHALEELEKGNLEIVADISLTYYDKSYNYNHEKREMKNIFLIECASADAFENSKKIIEFANQQKYV